MTTGEGDILKRWGPYALLMAVAYLAYANTFGNSWTYDDFPVIVENPDIRSWARFLTDSYPGRPLRELTYLLDHALFGMNPAGWHLQQIFWHGLNACLLFVLGRKLKISRPVALVAALLFLLHPLQVEVVANLSHRKDSLALAGTLGAILCYLQYLHADQRKIRWLLAAMVSFVLAITAKQNALVVPFILVAYELLLIPRSSRFLVRSRGLLAAFAAIAIAAAGWLWQSAGGWQKLAMAMQDTLSFKANYFEPVTLTVYYLTVLKSWVFIGLRLFWPVDLALEYTFPVATGLFDAWVLAGLAALVVATVLIIVSARRWPALCWLLIAALLLFLPTANLWPLTYLAADRYLYAPLGFLALLLGFVLDRVPMDNRLLLPPMLVVLLVFASLTWQQNRVWRSPETLWTQAIKVSPESSFALNNLGNLSLQAGNRAAAESYYRRSVGTNPLNPTAHFNLGWLAEQRQDLPAAISHYRQFARLDHPVYRQQLETLRQHLLRTYGVRL